MLRRNTKLLMGGQACERRWVKPQAGGMKTGPKSSEGQTQRWQAGLAAGDVAAPTFPWLSMPTRASEVQESCMALKWTAGPVVRGRLMAGSSAERGAAEP